MTTQIKVGFDESSRAVTAHVSVTSDELNENEVLEKSQNLFKEAQAYSVRASMKRV